jgi:dTMP kinase
MALLFAADRCDHLDAEIVPNLLDGVTVVSDRYDYSSVAYQSVDVESPDAVDWIRSINRRARRPDLTIVLDVRAEIAAKRRRERTGRPELYEQPEIQARLAEFYAQLDRHFPGERIVHINGELQTEAVCQAVIAEVDALRKLG